MSKVIILDKKMGETPLECLNRYKIDNNITEPMTYAGRLDPMASGLLIALIGDECKNKNHYNRLNKEYEFEILTGFFTDTHDILGLVEKYNEQEIDKEMIIQSTLGTKGKFVQQYPSYSSRTIGGKQMHYLARNNMLNSAQIPSQNIEIYNIEYLGKYCLNKTELNDEINRRISLVSGNFRQKEITFSWNKILNESKDENFEILRFKLNCSSGTYVRGLVRDISQKLNIPLCTWNITRTAIGIYQKVDREARPRGDKTTLDNMTVF
jgi:tRNA pseudouridine55 synthase